MGAKTSKPKDRNAQILEMLMKEKAMGSKLHLLPANAPFPSQRMKTVPMHKNSPPKAPSPIPDPHVNEDSESESDQDTGPTRLDVQPSSPLLWSPLDAVPQRQGPPGVVNQSTACLACDSADASCTLVTTAASKPTGRPGYLVLGLDWEAKLGQAVPMPDHASEWCAIPPTTPVHVHRGANVRVWTLPEVVDTEALPMPTLLQKLGTFLASVGVTLNKGLVEEDVPMDAFSSKHILFQDPPGDFVLAHLPRTSADTAKPQGPQECLEHAIIRAIAQALGDRAPKAFREKAMVVEGRGMVRQPNTLIDIATTLKSPTRPKL